MTADAVDEGQADVATVTEEPPAPEPQAADRLPGQLFTFAFKVGLGALSAYFLMRAGGDASHALLLVALAAFLAVSLEPIVAWLIGLGIRRRPFAVGIVALGCVLALAGLLAAVVPPAAQEISALIKAVPHLLSEIKDRSTWLGKLEVRYHFVEKTQSALKSDKVGNVAFNGVIGAGKFFFSALTGTLAVTALTFYFLAGLPRIRRFLYRMAPAPRRPRVAEIGDEIMAQVGRYMLGNVATSIVAGLATYVWVAAWSIPYPAALGVLVGLMDMVPVVGSTIGGAIVSLVALSVSLPIALGTLAFYIGFRIAEDYLLMPKVNRYTVDVHPVITVVAVIVGGALLGIIGAFVAIPVAVAVKLVLEEVVIPRLDER